MPRSPVDRDLKARQVILKHAWKFERIECSTGIPYSAYFIQLGEEEHLVKIFDDGMVLCDCGDSVKGDNARVCYHKRASLFLEMQRKIQLKREVDDGKVSDLQG